MRLTQKEQSECGMFCPGWQKGAWDVLSAMVNLCGMFCPGCQKMAWVLFCPGMFCTVHVHYYNSLDRKSLLLRFIRYNIKCAVIIHYFRLQVLH